MLIKSLLNGSPLGIFLTPQCPPVLSAHKRVAGLSQQNLNLYLYSIAMLYQVQDGGVILIIWIWEILTSVIL